jgi:predicted AlkP superfamily phosphohydrolase/phosphomutase
MAAPALTVIGLDAATFDVVDPLLEAGRLPNLGRLLERGASGVLRSTTHPLTPHAWSTMVTGVNAGRHGIWDFTERDDSGYGLRLINGSYRRAPALWDRLAAAGRRAGIVNIPFTWPAPDLDGGFAIAGMDASFREQGMTAPASLFGELRSRLGAFELDHSYPLKDGLIDLDGVRRAAEQKVAAALWLAERFSPELLFVVFMAADHVQHLGWAEWEEQRGAESAVAGTYRILDEAVGALV